MLTRIFPPTTSTEDGGLRAGFTLIELLVVVTIIALATFLVVPSVTSYFKLSLNSAARELSSTVKEAYNAAVLTGNVYRMAYDLKEEKYWVEAGPANALLDTKESKEKEERRRKFSLHPDEAPASAFQMDKTVTRKKVSLPSGVSFEDVLTQANVDPVTDGMAYTHIFPHGLTEQTVIHLMDTAKHHASLVISPLIGKSDLYDRYMTANELFKK